MIPDGVRFSEEADAAASEAVLETFSTPAGGKALAYLRKITTGRVLPPTATDAELRDLEGRRAMVAIIDMRMADGRERRAAAGAAGGSAAGDGGAAGGREQGRRKRRGGAAILGT